jgi:hypothetical protein
MPEVATVEVVTVPSVEGGNVPVEVTDVAGMEVSDVSAHRADMGEVTNMAAEAMTAKMAAAATTSTTMVCVGGDRDQ